MFEVVLIGASSIILRLSAAGDPLIRMNKRQRLHSFDQLLRDSARMTAFLAKPPQSSDANNIMVQEDVVVNEVEANHWVSWREPKGNSSSATDSLETILVEGLGAVFDDDEEDSVKYSLPLERLTEVYEEQLLSNAIACPRDFYLTARLWWDPQCAPIRAYPLEPALLRLAASAAAVQPSIDSVRIVQLARTLHLGGRTEEAAALLDASLQLDRGDICRRLADRLNGAEDLYRTVSLAQYRLHLVVDLGRTDRRYLQDCLQAISSRLTINQPHPVSIGIRDGLLKMEALLRLHESTMAKMNAKGDFLQKGFKSMQR